MKAKQTILKTLAIASMTLITASASFAHSDHDHSTVPFKWQFSEKLNSKVEKNLNSTKPSGVVGLNPFEQKKFNHYGIKVGNKFSSRIRNIDVIFERTSAGIKIVNASVFDTTSNANIVPIKKVSKISKVTMQKPFHIGHDHMRLPVEWSFGDTTNSKIAKHMFEGKGKLSVGLTRLEQSLLAEYGIKTGNKFQLSISGHRFLVEKTSGGLIVLNHVEDGNIAKAELGKDTVKDNI